MGKTNSSLRRLVEYSGVSEQKKHHLLGMSGVANENEISKKLNKQFGDFGKVIYKLNQKGFINDFNVFKLLQTVKGNT
ncbi:MULTISPECIES: hypothetical protein [Thermoactinomyces]|uniref:Uncharacterized protein n=1 Tax=Thermoactinomyces daqus TaxID=1329516 RepID=A0A7W1XB48_9BACL|nr:MULTISPECIES: hypothetical protein [Thermoactinomyces]MBA4543437.1 hypothetical protein [Thermoactinomyces daqus]MBH8606031.1 hypothetical protein [Thermoactinomyces sp. CICC 10521]